MRTGGSVRSIVASVLSLAMLGLLAPPEHAFAQLRQDFTLSAVPGALSLTPGGSGMVTVAVTGVGGFSEPVTVTAAPPAGLLAEPNEFTLNPGEMRAVTVSASAAAETGTSSLVFTGVSRSITTGRTASVAVTIEPAPPTPPIIQAIVPPSVATGTRGNVLRVTGQNFQPGAVVTSASAGVRVTGSSILGPGLAEVVVSVRPDAPAGAYLLELTNPDGGATTGGATLLVVPAGALGSPLAVTATRIVTPRPWQIVEHGERLHARALLATSGTGTVVGTWLLDGVPFDRFTRVVSGGYPVEVKSSIPIPASFTGERRLELAIESPGGAPSRGVPFLQAAESRTGIRILAPATEVDLDTDAAARAFRWTLVPGASGYEVEIDAGERTAVRRRVTDTEWRPDEALLRELDGKEAHFRVRAVFPGEVFENPTPWLSFAVTTDGEGTSATGSDAALRLVALDPAPAMIVAAARRPSSSVSPQEAPPGGEIRLALQGTANATESSFAAPPAVGRLQASSQLDVRGPALDLLSTADISGSHDLEDPWDGREESRNWLVRLGASQPDFRQQVAVGFAPPSFFDQAEFLTVMTSGGAFEGKFDSPAGSLSYYRSLDLSGNDSFDPFEPEVDAAAYELSDESGRYLFRTTLLRATDPGIEGFSAGGEGRALGVIGTVDLGPQLRLLGELATGDFEPAEGAFGEERDGRAFRVSATGAAGTFDYGLTIGRTDAGFVNPANQGFTPGGVSDRTRAEITLGKAVGPTSLSGSFRHLRGGIAEAAGDPRTTENGGELTFSMPVSERVSVSAGGNLVEQRGDAVEELGLPATDRSQKGFDLSVSQWLGPVSLTQTLTVQDFTDRAQPIYDQRVTGISLFGNGSPTPFLTVSANLADTRIRSAPELGTTDQFLVSLQPALSIARLSLEISPRAAFTRVSNELLETESNTDQYQLVARWSPQWQDGLVSAEVGADWSRSWSGFETDAPGFDRQILFTLSLNWRFDRTWPRSDP